MHYIQAYRAVVPNVWREGGCSARPVERTGGSADYILIAALLLGQEFWSCPALGNLAAVLQNRRRATKRWREPRRFRMAQMRGAGRREKETHPNPRAS